MKKKIAIRSEWDVEKILSKYYESHTNMNIPKHH